MKKYLLFAIALFSLFVVNTNASELPSSNYNFTFLNFSDVGFTFGVSRSLSQNGTIQLWNLSTEQKYSYFVLDFCTTGWDNFSITNNGYNNYFKENYLLYRTNQSCSTGNYTGVIYRLQLNVGKYIESEGDGLFAASYIHFTGSGNYHEYKFVSSVLSDTDILSPLIAASGNSEYQKEINQELDNIQDKQNQTNKKLDEVKSTITDETDPKLDALKNSSGWLPAGPLDSILNLPLSFLNNLSTNLSKTCQPVNLPLPYVDKTLTLPCLNTIYSEIDGLTVWINGIGIIASVFILFTYLINLYKWVDDTLTFRENNYIDNWGGM